MKHDYIVTFSGEEFTPLTPDIKKIHIEDIAHSLSLLCRANGHISYFYSVAQHCINCVSEAKARGYPAKVQLACLMHDASEAYISDITRPVKKHLADYKKIEKTLQDVIYTKFLGAPLTEDEFFVVDEIDSAILVYELNAMLNSKTKKFTDVGVKLASTPSLEQRNFSDVENEFLKMYYGIMHAGIVQGR